MKLSDVSGGDAGGDAPPSGRLRLSDVSDTSKTDTAPKEDDSIMGRIGRAVAPVARGVAPYAAGAAAGAAMGAPFAGVGAIPGAIAGAGAVGLSDLATGVYNPIAKATGLPKVAGPSEAVNEGLTKLGVPESKTPGARVAQSTTEGIAGALSGAGAAKRVGEAVAGPLGKGIAGALSEGPGKQAVSGALAGAAGQTAAEAGAGPVGQTVASLAGGVTPYGKQIGKGAIETAAAPRSEPKSAAGRAAEAGYVLPPTEISEKPSRLSGVLSSWGGKVRLQQDASVKNQVVTNGLAAKALGLPEGTPLTDQAFNDVRTKAGEAYQAVKDVVPEIRVDDEFRKAIPQIGGSGSQAQKYYPGLMKNPEILKLRENLLSRDAAPTQALVEVVKDLRFNANANLKAIGDPSKHALGLTQRQAADAIDSLIERNVTHADKYYADKFSEARTVEADANKAVTQAQNVLNRVEGKLQTSKDIYVAAAAMKEQKAARAELEKAEAALESAQDKKASIVARLQEVQAMTERGDLVNKYRDARKLIAKSYDLETATNTATGDVTAAGLAKLAAKGRPLTDELKTIADVAASFPKSTQNPSKFGGSEAYSVGDFAGAAASVMAGHPEGALLALGRQPVRSAILSKPYQNMAMRRSPMERALAPEGVPILDTYHQSDPPAEAPPR